MNKKPILLFMILILPISVYADKWPGDECAPMSNVPHVFDGVVIWANGTAVPSNNSINATLGNYHFTTVTDSNGQYGYSSLFQVLNCPGDSNTITFYIQGVATNTTTFSSGGDTTFNITAGGVVCGDGRCNGTETTGSTNEYPTCNRDCGSPSITTTTGGGGGGGGGAGGGGGGGAAVPSKTDLDSKATFTTVGYTAKQTQGDTAIFTVAGTEYTAELTKLKDDSATITVAGQSTILNIGQTAQFDVNGEGVNDISVTLKGIEGGRAEVVYKMLAKAPEKPAEEVPPEAEKKEEVKPPEKEVIPPPSKAWIGWTIVAVIVLIGLIIYFRVAKKKKPIE